MNITEKLEAFRALVEADKTRYCERMGYMGQWEGIARTVVKIGKKWARVDVGHSGVYMVEMATGQIVGIKAYGVPHPGHRYGTLDTIQDWDWSEYRAIRKTTATA